MNITKIQQDFIESKIKQGNLLRYQFTREEIMDLIPKIELIAEKKVSESNYKTDKKNIAGRFMTGVMGELAIEKALGVKFVDLGYKSVTHSKFFNHPDLKNIGLNIGVKTVRNGKSHLVPHINRYPQIICLRDSNSSIIVCGVADVKTLNEKQSEDLVLSRDLKNLNDKKRGDGRKDSIKTGYYGLEDLIDFNEYFFKK